MRTTACLASLTLILALGCSDDTAADGDGETSGDGDGDPTGDGDGDPTGDGDGDDLCSCENTGSYDQCQASETPLLVGSTLSWPVGTDLELDEVCTVTANSVGESVELDCPAGLVTLTLTLAPAWAPALGVGEQLRLRASESPGMSEGDDWQYLRWQLDRADDSTMVASYLDSEILNFLDDPFATTIETDLCPHTCGEYVNEPVGLRMTGDANELFLFTGQTGDLGDHQVHVAVAERHLCADVGPGRYTVAIVAEPEPVPDACALVLDQTYSSQEELECGIGPNGVVLCHWTVGFDALQYVWNHSDVGEVDDYACDGLDLLSVPEGQVLGSVSADGSVLTWDGVLYDRN